MRALAWAAAGGLPGLSFLPSFLCALVPVIRRGGGLAADVTGRAGSPLQGFRGGVHRRWLLRVSNLVDGEGALVSP